MFPFDRQLIHLENFHFHWTGEEPSDWMNVVQLDVECAIMKEEWQIFSALIQPENNGLGDARATNFHITLRVGRQPHFYVDNVLLVAYSVSLVSSVPMLSSPNDLNGRIGILAAGFLTIIALKFSVADRLPVVPYTTFLDTYLLAAMAILFTACIVAAIAFLSIEGGAVEDTVVRAERVLVGTLLIAWTLGTFILCIRAKTGSLAPRWEDVQADQQPLTK